MSKISAGNFLEWDIATLSDAIRKKQLSPSEITKGVLDRIAVVNKELNAYITVVEEEALAQAAKAEEEINNGYIRGPLHGIPIAIKDNIYTKDIKTTMGSEIYKEYIPKKDASVVEKLKKAGAIIVGKTNTHQFAYGTTGDRSYFGPVRNPYHTTKISGGSSSGSAAALASSLCFAALGTDTGGSIRIPSSFNGVVGMKPTFGRVSNQGVYPLARTMDHVGVMTKTVGDNAILLNMLAGYDEDDAYSIQTERPDFTKSLHKGIEGMVIGVPAASYFDANDEISTSIKDAIDTFEKAGAKIKTIYLPEWKEMASAFQMILKCEAYALHKQRLLDYPNKWDDEVKDRLLTGENTKAEEYIKAQEIKQQAKRNLLKIYSDVNLILTPTVPILPTDLEQREVEINGVKVHISLVLNKLTCLFNVTGFPSLSMPCGMSAEGFPIGMQLIGKPFDEANIYRFAAAFEASKEIIT